MKTTSNLKQQYYKKTAKNLMVLTNIISEKQINLLTQYHYKKQTKIKKKKEREKSVFLF